ncbi:uncharacterized protein F5891DRAFT_985001 [Suillus fuscotomentosus]|uniref:Uncharacterized protein n=1 Tax=Suillus fuscotomentosus TaxID=1912939 RepID=A0AAD4DX68_9AGAM|nr:uncharacterized protein F5891DRAFT_985001 [Suillus fuscotomentosus]KAG1894514.1 hypothetical protein F5891DRAFT_985001 [Suillus fuscotomentosus]
MAPPRWKSAEQLTWLQNEVPTYLQMQKEKKLVRFFELLYPKWFRSEKSPDHNDANIDQSSLDSDAAVNEIIAELDHENAIIPISDVKKQSNLDAELAEALKDPIKHRGKPARGTRDLKEVEVYSQLHYESKVKPLVSDNIRENKLALPDQRLCAVRHHTSECFAKESEDVKESTIIAGYISRFTQTAICTEGGGDDNCAPHVRHAEKHREKAAGAKGMAQDKDMGGPEGRESQLLEGRFKIGL